MDQNERDYHWQTFYSKERECLTWIAEESQCLLNLDGLDLSNLNEGNHPQFIRQIHIVPKALQEAAQNWFIKLRDNFVEVTEFTNDSKQKLPTRLPQIFTGAERVIHSNYPAYQSLKLKSSGLCDVFRTEPYNSATEESNGLLEANTACDSLNSAGLLAHVRFIPSQNCHAVSVESADLHKWSGCGSIQRRMLTGQRYEARISLIGEDKPVRTHLGLILLCQDSIPFIDESLPRKKRSDAMAKEQIRLPIQTKYTFFSND